MYIYCNKEVNRFFSFIWKELNVNGVVHILNIVYFIIYLNMTISDAPLVKSLQPAPSGNGTTVLMDFRTELNV